jgi:quercetin dioxygenase-like cupin family protein
MYEVITGELEMPIDGVTQIVRTGIVAIAPSNICHSVRALTDGRVIVVDHLARREVG